jgi:predicted Ser/Thr protein kinase
MDVLGINKEEMHHPFKHIIVRDEKPVLIDFERCHYTEKQQNVTQFVQYLTSKKIQEAFEKKHILIDKEKILSLVQAYKKKVDKAALDKIIGTIH